MQVVKKKRREGLCVLPAVCAERKRRGVCSGWSCMSRGRRAVCPHAPTMPGLWQLSVAVCTGVMYLQPKVSHLKQLPAHTGVVCARVGAFLLGALSAASFHSHAGLSVRVVSALQVVEWLPVCRARQVAERGPDFGVGSNAEH